MLRSNPSSIKKVVSPQQFIRMVKTQKDAIASTRFIAPRLGSKGLGKVVVTYKYEPSQSISGAR